MLMLGFSSGLPFFLTGNTLGYWLRDAGTTLTAIGFLSWVGPRVFAEVPVGADHRSRRRAGASAGSAAGAAGCSSPSSSSPSACSASSAIGLKAGLAPLGILALDRRVLLVDAGHRGRRLADRGGRRRRRTRAALLRLSARLPFRDPRQRRAHPDHREPLRLADLVRDDGAR